MRKTSTSGAMNLIVSWTVLFVLLATAACSVGGDPSASTTSASGGTSDTTATTSSITFVSASPSSISLKGTGGTEQSKVTFKVVDGAGAPVGGVLVAFSLDTNIGGISLTRIQETSDSSTGEVSTYVESGTVATPIIVTAATTDQDGNTLLAKSSGLAVSTGMPDQDSISLSATAFNFSGWDYDGETSTITVRLGDHFNNPVPDGTTVYFTTEGGNITSSCTTSNGACDVTLTSKLPRPDDGRVTVLAYAVGEESFTDLDGDGLADLNNAVSSTTEMIDANSNPTDLPEAFVDYDEDGVLDPNSEPFIDFNNDHTYDIADGQYNGSLCNEIDDGTGRVSSPGTCSSNTSIHIRKSAIFTFSTEDADLSLTTTPITLASCTDQKDLNIIAFDTNGNPMPTGTTISVAPNGNDGVITVEGTSSFTVANSPNNAANVQTTGLTKFDTMVSGGGSNCASGKSQPVIITVTTPKGRKTLYYVTVNVS